METQLEKTPPLGRGSDHEEEKKEWVYSPKTVEKILRNYLDIKYTLEGKSPELPDTYVVTLKRQYGTERVPLGMTSSSAPWPFMEPKGATKMVDGKATARLMEDLLVSCLDLENGLKRLHDTDLKLLYLYYIFQTHTLDELAAEIGITSKGSLQRRLQRIVSRLTRFMEQGTKGAIR